MGVFLNLKFLSLIKYMFYYLLPVSRNSVYKDILYSIIYRDERVKADF